MMLTAQDAETSWSFFSLYLSIYLFQCTDTG